MLEGVPRVTDRIKAGAGSISSAIEALRGDDSPDAQSFIGIYDSLSKSDQRRLTLEDVFTAAGLSARRFVEVVTGALMQQSADVTKMMISVAQPKVAKSLIKAATDSVPIVCQGLVVGRTNGDVKAMEIFGKISGMVPVPKGAQNTINIQQLNQGDTREEIDSEEVEVPGSMDEFLMEMQEVLRPKQLDAPPDNSIPMNAPEVEYIDAEV